MVAENLEDHTDRLGLPDSIATRPRDSTEKVKSLRDLHIAQVKEHGRNFHLGLMIAFIGVVEEACGRAAQDPFPDLLSVHPPVEERGGRRLNTLTIDIDGGRKIGLRGYYNQVEETIRFHLARRAYPSMAPHATQAWAQHREEFDRLLELTAAERAALLDLLWAEVLKIPRPAYRTADDAQPRPFVTILTGFETAPGEPAGAVFQAMAFAYYNTELRHLVAVEADKVRVGGARRGNVGDIDGWDGSQIVQSIEVKDLDLTEENEGELAGFFDNLSDWPNATAIVLANSFTETLAKKLRGQNIFTLTRAEMIQSCEAWDMERQRQAVRAMDYMIVRKEAHPSLAERFREFLVDRDIPLD